MSEPVTLEQPKSKKFSMKDLKGTNGLLLISLVCLLLAAICSFSTSLVSWIFSERLFDFEINDMVNVANSFASSIVQLMCGLLMPLSLFLLSTNTKKDNLAKIFMFVAVGFLAVQLLGSVIAAFFALLTYEDPLPSLFRPLSTMLSSVSGTRLLSAPIFFLQFLIRGHFDFLDFVRSVFYYTLLGFSSLFFMLSNAACGFAFMQMSNIMKKKK